MGFFTVGNLLTLGIVILVLILYRQMDRRSRSLDKVSKYVEKLKDELRTFVDEKAADVRGYGVDLQVEKESARELMNRLRITNEEVAEKAAAVKRIEERIGACESSMDELAGLAGRVQENLSRIRDESAFVDGAARRVTEARAGLEDLEQGLESLEIRFERDNAEALHKVAEAVIGEAKSAVSSLAAQAEIIERKAEDHREAVDKAEQERAASLARDMEIVNKTLKNAVEQAGLTADHMEEAALVRLREQAQDRINKLKAAEDERFKAYHESAKNRVAEVQNLVKAIREEWKTERQDWETRGKALRDEWKKDFQEIRSQAVEAEKLTAAGAEALEKRLEDLQAKTGEAAGAQEAFLVKALEDMKQKALEITGTRLEEYRQAQDAEFSRLEALTEDSRKLDAELRRNMQEVISRARDDFALFEKESAHVRQVQAGQFAATVAGLKTEIEEVGKDLADLKSVAYENVSEKLKGFEDDFLADLARRGGDIDHRFDEWQDSLETRLAGLGEDAAAKRQELESSLTDEMKKSLSIQNERIGAELEHLKTDTEAFEEAVRGRMNAADESLESYKEQLDRNLEEAREDAERTIKAEIGNYALSTAELIRQNQRDLEGKLKDISDYVENRNGELTALLDASRQNIQDLDGRVAVVRSAIDEAGQDADARRHEILARTDEQAKALEAQVRDAERRIKEFFDQTKLIDRAGEIKQDMERRIEDLRGDIGRLDQRRAELAQMESQFVKIRRLEDEVNAKMTRFLSEKHRIEQMEADFTRLLQISRAVEEKLTQVTASDDMLQQLQIQIRRLEEALEGTEEKYQRIEKKDQVLEETSDSIDRNFKVLQESEKALKKIGDDIARLGVEEESLRTALGALSGESEKARETADQISVLDKALADLEDRTQAMHKAREWIARTETRLEELNRDIQEQIKLLGSLVKAGGKKAVQDKGAPPPADRENVIKLARQGWTVKEIAKVMKMSQGEVELILEIPQE
jgi:chromosome segregation ATPase